MTITIDPNDRLPADIRSALLAGSRPTHDQVRRINEIIEDFAQADPDGYSDYEANRLEARVVVILSEPVRALTVEELAELTWKVESVDAGYHCFEELDPEPVGENEDGEWVTEPRYLSYLNGGCTLRCIEYPEITYEIDWTAQGGERSVTSAYAFDVTVNENGENVLDTGSIEIVDEDGDTVTPSDAVRDIGHDIEGSIDWEDAVSEELPVPGTEDIDTDEGTDMDTIELSRDSGPDVRFRGEKIASASSRQIEGARSMRWTELALYRTAGGKLVCQEVGKTIWQGERDRFAVHIADTEADLVDAVGYGRLAKELYDEAGIDHVEEIG